MRDHAEINFTTAAWMKSDAEEAQCQESAVTVQGNRTFSRVCETAKSVQRCVERCDFASVLFDSMNSFQRYRMF